MLYTKNLRERYGFDEEEKKFLEEANTAVTSDMNESKVFVNLILAKKIETATQEMNSSANKIESSLDTVSEIIEKSSKILKNSTKEIKDSIDAFNSTAKKFSESSDSLSGKLLWLNIILTIATVVGALATASVAYNEVFPSKMNNTTCIVSYPIGNKN